MSLLAQAIANKLDGRDQLSASYFHPGSTKDGHHDHAHKDGSFVILTLAYQLAQNIPETKAAIAQSIMCHDKIFNSEVLPAVQMECLITSPLKDASEVLDVEGEFSKRVFLIYGLDDSVGKDFPVTLLQAMAAALPLTRDGKFPHKLVVIGDGKQAMEKWVSSEKMKPLVSTKVQVDDLFPRSGWSSWLPALMVGAAVDMVSCVLDGLI